MLTDDRSPARRVTVVAVLAAATAANYLAWLGWDHNYYVDAQGNVAGPYQPWQVVGLVLVVGVLAGVAGWRRCAWAALLVIPTVLTICFSITGITEPNNDGLWPVGAFLVAIGSFLGVSLVALPAEAIRRRIGEGALN